jgi:hypothetical protein
MTLIEGTTKAMTTEGMRPLLFPSQEDSIKITYTYANGESFVGYAADLLDASDLIRLDQEATENVPTYHGALMSVTLTF